MTAAPRIREGDRVVVRVQRWTSGTVESFDGQGTAFVRLTRSGYLIPVSLASEGDSWHRKEPILP